MALHDARAVVLHRDPRYSVSVSHHYDDAGEYPGLLAGVESIVHRLLDGSHAFSATSGAVVSGHAMGVVVRTGGRTFFGQLADEIAGRRMPTAFDKGVDRITCR